MELEKIKMTVDQYMSVINIIETFKEDDAIIRELVKLFHGDVTLPINQAKMLLNQVKITLMQEETKFVQRFKFNGVEYGFIPNLNDISTGEYLDLDNLMKNENQNLHRIMAVLYRPVTDSKGKLYNIEEYQGSLKYAEIMKNVDHEIIKGALFFFTQLGMELLQTSNTYLKQQVNLMKKITTTS